ncbi:MAG: PcfJ domain-containing protein [Oscillospiraceae bacterium]|nr:PcfJ domain-containing protein [Oscillospiraceae bacterium]MBQ9905225.1 PcfJ domain-containing protein [Oscillospiraceae bacterium]
MKQARKDALLHSFPVIPSDLMDKMKGKYAGNYVVLLTNGNELFARCFHRYFGGQLVERQRYVFAKDGSVRYGRDDGQPWTVRKEFREPVFCQACYGYSFDNSYTLLNREAIEKSCLKYCRYDLYTGDLLMEYLHLYCKHPNVEYIMKSGYSNLLIERCTGYWGGRYVLDTNRHINWKSNNLLQMLGLNRDEFKLFTGHEDLYDEYVMWREHYPKCKPKDLLLIGGVFGYEYGTMERFVQATGLKPQRIARYLLEHEVEKHDYDDYLRQCMQLKYNLHDTAISMPRDFMAMHARLSEMIHYNETQAARQQFKENMEYRNQLEFAFGGLFIRQPKNMTEIINEGKRLNHCVGGYAKRHANGKLHIMFIRTVEKPDVPFYTVEVDLFGKIVQVRGLRNCKTTPEVDAFMEAYKDYLAEVFGKKQKVRITA